MKFCDILDFYSANKFSNSLDNSFNNSGDINNLNPHQDNNDLNTKNSHSLLSNFSSNNLSKNNSYVLSNNKNPSESQNKYRFIIPVIIHPDIANLKMRELVQRFRSDLLVYDMEKRNGIIFNLPDIIQCGMFGICGIARSRDDCFKLFENSIHLVKSFITNKENKNISLSIEARSDIIEINDLIGRIRYFLKNAK